MKAFFLDFDGVIIDSIDECFLLSKDVYYGFSHFKYDINTYKKTFYRYRGFVNPPFEYMVLHKTIESYLKNNSLDFKLKFTELKKNIIEDQKNKFEYLFFQLRKYYQEDINNWLSLHKITDYGKTLQNKKLPDYFIVTTKNKESVRLLLNHYNIRIEKIFDIENHRLLMSKGNIISNFLDSSKYNQAVFIDDSVENLNSVKDKRIKCYFADWGYGSNTQYENYKFS